MKYELEVSERHFRRAFEKAVGKSILKILTEIVTNSDDSYRRMEAAGDPRSSSPEFGSILIEIDRRKRVISVMDQAEGLSDSEMKDRFVTYGQESVDRSKGFRTRSLFGKGLRDVMFTQEHGAAKSIKNDKVAIAKFDWKIRKGSTERKPIVDIEGGWNAKQAIRDGMGVRVNGTRCEFKLKEDVSVPQHTNLKEKLSNFYMLRMILSNQKRSARLRTISSSGLENEDEIRYSPPVGKLVKTDTYDFEYEDRKFRAEVAISMSEEPLVQGEGGYENREGGILVLDEDNNVLDLTLFRFDRDPYADRIFGTAKILGIGQFIRERLNAERPEEILTETREGFEKTHPMYSRIASVVESVLQPIVKEEERLRKGSVSNFSDRDLRHIHDAMDELNRAFERYVGKTKGGSGFAGRKSFLPDSIAFARPEITITEGVATPIALLANCGVVPDGTRIALSTDNAGLDVKPKEIQVKHCDSKDVEDDKGVVIGRTWSCVLNICGSHVIENAAVAANAGADRTTLLVHVIPEEITYPENGLEFDPSNVTVRDNATRTLALYVDVGSVPVGSIIAFTSDTPASVTVKGNEVVFSDKHLLSPDVGCIQVEITGKGIGTKAKVGASFRDLNATAFVSVVSKRTVPPTPETGKRFKEPEFREISLLVPSWLTPEGVIIINMNDEVNKRYFGEDPYKNYETLLHCKTRVADLVLDECLYEIVTRAWGTTLEKRYPDDPATDIRMRVAEFKYQLGPKIHSVMVPRDGFPSETKLGPPAGTEDAWSRQTENGGPSEQP